MRPSQVALVALSTLLAAPALARPAASWPGEPTQVESPYLFVEGGDPGVDLIPLQETRADVKIAGTIAHVRVTQVYENAGRRPIEAIYVFPGSTRSAVFGMRMTIGGRTIVAQIDEKAAARQTYEAAKAQGKAASLLEQQRPNVFQMNVANVMPGDVVRVELDYVELVTATDGVYELVYPTVVGPRYPGSGGQPSSSGEAWAANPHVGAGAPVPFKWGARVELRGGMPIQAVQSTSHRIAPRYASPSEVTVEVDETTGGNKDFVFRYKLAGDKLETGVLLFPGADESFFLMMAQPPARVAANAIPPREYIFVVDVSGSMHGHPLDTTKALMRSLFARLRPIDHFNVMTFSGGSNVLAERSVPATAANLERAIQALERERGGGGTEIVPALRRALALPRAEGTSTSIVVVTDGYVTVEPEVFDVISGGLGTANLFALGIGSSVNRYLIEGMAHAGMGEPFVVLKPAQAQETADALLKLIETPVLTDVKVEFDGFAAYDVEPVKQPDVLAERPLVVFGKYRGAPGGRITISGRSGVGRHFDALPVSAANASEGNAALRYLWARHRIQRVQDFARIAQRPEARAQVTQLGLRYGLLTDYTSFVAVDDAVRNTSGASETVKQPLPMPEGVSHHALGGAAAGKMARVAPMAAPAEVGEVRGMALRGVGVGGGGRGQASSGALGVGSAGVLGGRSGDARSATDEDRQRSPEKKEEPRRMVAAEATPRPARPSAAASASEPAKAKDDGRTLRPTPGVELQASDDAVARALTSRFGALRVALATRAPGEAGELWIVLRAGQDGVLADVRVRASSGTLTPALIDKIKAALRGLSLSPNQLAEVTVRIR
jgi:Ca-activated chloride channel family protein